MFDRIRYKELGKAAFLRNYWPSVLVALIAGLPGSLEFIYTIRDNLLQNPASQQEASQVYYEATSQLQANTAAASWLIGIVVGLLGISTVLGLAGHIFLVSPLQVGGARFFWKNSSEKAEWKEVGYGFNPDYLKKVGIMFGMMIRVFLWSLLFVIPGIVKAYEYRMVPYLIAEDGSLTTKDALQMSKAMMYGNKWNAFVFDLSFLGWLLLSGMTMGLLAVFFVAPYKNAAEAEMYKALKQQVEIT